MLTAQTISIVKSTAPVLAEKGLLITKEFYRRLFANHPEMKHIFNMTNQRDDSQARALADAVFAYASHIDQLDALLPAVERIASKHASIGVEPHHYPIVGENLLAAIQAVLGLAEDDPAIKAWEEAYRVLAKVFIDTEENIYASNEQRQGGWRGFRSFIIDKIVDETSEVKSFYLKPTDGGHICHYVAGQYIGIKVSPENSNYDEIRQYSLSDWGHNKHYRITVKAEPKGVVSKHLHDCREGDEVQLRAPTGQFRLNKSAKRHVFISGGVGITPLYSMLKEALLIETKPEYIQFIECCRSAEHQVLKYDLAAIHQEYFFDYKRVFETGDSADWRGYLTAEVLNKWIPNKDVDVYFCGPKPFMSALKRMLNEINIPDSQLHYEIFGPTTAI